MRVAPAYRSVELRVFLIREKHLLHLDRRLKYRITIQHNHGLDNDEGRLRRHVQLVVHRDKVAHVLLKVNAEMKITVSTTGSAGFSGAYTVRIQQRAHRMGWF
jgi:hypothetical protein